MATQGISAVVHADLQPIADTRARTDSSGAESLAGGKLKLLTKEVPSAQRVHSSYFDYVYWCFLHHRPIVMSPDLVWFECVAQVAKDVTSMHCLPYYKKKFGVPEGAEVCFDPEGKLAPGVLDAGLVAEAVSRFFPAFDPAELFAPRFSTTTAASRTAALACFADVVSSMMRLRGGCGIPAVRLLGTTGDWAQLARRAGDLARHFDRSAEYLHGGVAPIAEELSRLVRERDPAQVGEFFRGFIGQENADCDSGSSVRPHLSGWITQLYGKGQGAEVEPADFPRHAAKIVWDDVRVPGHAYMALHGVFSSADDPEGVPVPEFGRVTFACGDPAQSHMLLSQGGKMMLKRTLQHGETLERMLRGAVTPVPQP